MGALLATELKWQGPSRLPPQKSIQESKQSMGSSVLYQSIELLSREKGIEPGIVVGAV